MPDERQTTEPLRYSLIAKWDAEAQMWCGYSDDILGLVLQADTLADLLCEAAEVAPELMRLNGQPNPKGEQPGGR